jgi:hypothetical protein
MHNPQVDCAVIRRVKTILPKESVRNACGDKTQDFQQEAEKKENRKTERQQIFKERQKQAKTTSWYCFKNMQYNELKCCCQCFQLTEETMATK